MRFSAGISTPNNRGIFYESLSCQPVKSFPLSVNYLYEPLITFLHPCRCLCRGFLQMTRTTFLRFTILQDSQSLLTAGRTFIFPRDENRGEVSACLFLAKRNPPLRQIVGRNL